MNLDPDFVERLEAEFQKCKEDPLYFIENYLGCALTESQIKNIKERLEDSNKF